MTSGWRFGSHTSVAGGLYNGLETASKLSMATCQIFTKNASQWNAKPLKEEDIERFKSTWISTAIGEVFSHASYLINLASPKEDLRLKSIDSMLLELERANTLGLGGVVVHPGAYVSSTEQEGIDAFHKSVGDLFDKYEMTTAKLLIENTAGQGTTLGRTMGELSAMLKPFQTDPRIGLCIDSCHAHAAGYDLSQEDGLNRLIDELQQFELLDLVTVIHLNDSKKAAGTRVDRHEHIGLGTIGTDGISRFIHHEAIKKLPFILETEKGKNRQREDWDWVNLRTLHQMVGQEYNVPALELY